MRTEPERGPRGLVLAALVLTAAILCAFWPVLGNDFITSYDDERYVTGNRHVQGGLGLAGLSWASTATYAANWHPLTWMSHMLDWQLYGRAPMGHHLTNLLLHVANGLMLFFALHLATGSILRSSIVAALFGVHPLHVESVAWVAERKDVLSTLFWMLAIWAYVRYVTAPSIRRYAVVAGALALGLCAKPMLVTLPFVLLLLDHWPLGRFARGGRGALGPLVREKAPLLLLSAASSIVTFAAQTSGRAVATFEQFSLPARAANAVVSYAAYLWKTVWPRDLAVFYPHPRGSLPSWEVAGSAIVLALVTALAIRARRRRPYVLTGWLWYLGTLVPVIGLVQVGGQAMGDRYTYVPLVGIFLIAVWGLADAAESLPALRPASRGVVSSTAGDSPWILLPAGAVILALVACTRVQVGHWRDSVSLFEHALDATRDNFVAHGNLGHALAKRGRNREAVSHYQEALRLNPLDAETHNSLGLALCELGRLEEAVRHGSTALRLRPGYPEAHNNLGFALFRLGRVEEALAHYQEALRLEPDYAVAHGNLGAALVGQGRLAEAIEHCEQALRIDPGYAEAHNNLGLAFSAEGRLDEAIRHYVEALRLEPEGAKAHNNLGRALADSGRPGEAIPHYEEALRLDPDYPEAHNNLGITLFGMGRMEEAIRHYRDALRARPDYAEAESNLGGALTTQGKLDEAVEHLSRAIRIRPRYGVAHYNLAVAFYLKGDPGRAWAEVALARRNGFEPPSRFLEMLSEKLPEPRAEGD